MNHPKDKIIKVTYDYQEYDMFEMYFGFKSDKLEIKRDRSNRDRYGSKAKKLLKQENEKRNTKVT
jgi:hypothetical protein|tara:strand:+ start:1141 stop:1335 length:195 start_codon:yes stop_codon:yes gene_type:complete